MTAIQTVEQYLTTILAQTTAKLKDSNLLPKDVDSLKTLNNLAETLLTDLSENISDEDIIFKLSLLQSVQFQGSTTSFFKEVPNRLPPVDFISQQNFTSEIRLKSDLKIIKMLSEIQLQLVSIYKTRHEHRYRSQVNYDQQLVNSSTVFVNYMKTSKNKEYKNGDLAIDFVRGSVDYVNQGAAPVNVALLRDRIEDKEVILKKKQQQLFEYKELLVSLERQQKEQAAPYLPDNKKLDAIELEDLRENIEQLPNVIQMTQKEITIHLADLAKLQEALEDIPNYLHTMTGKNDKKSDILFRFGHQMIIAEMMREFEKSFQSVSQPSLKVTPFHELRDQRIHRIVRDQNNDVFVEIDVSFDSLILSDGTYGAFQANKRDLEWSKDANIIHEQRGALVNIQGRMKIVPDPDRKGEYYMQIQSYNVTSRTPDIVPKPQFIPAKYFQVESNLTDEEALRSVI